MSQLQKPIYKKAVIVTNQVSDSKDIPGRTTFQEKINGFSNVCIQSYQNGGILTHNIKKEK